MIVVVITKIPYFYPNKSFFISSKTLDANSVTIFAELRKTVSSLRK